MTDLAFSLWPELAAALALGLVVGALTGLPRERFALASAAILLVGLTVLAGLAVLRTVAGGTGLWIETAALLLGAYLAGCVLGGLGRAASGRPL